MSRHAPLVCLWVAVSMGEAAAKPFIFEIFFLGRHGTSRHFNLFHDVSKIFLCDRHDTFCKAFSMRSTLDVSCCVFLQIALLALRQVGSTYKLRGRRGTP